MSISGDFNGRADFEDLFPYSQAEIVNHAAAGQSTREVLTLFYPVARGLWKSCIDWWRDNRPTLSDVDLGKNEFAVNSSNSADVGWFYNLTAIVRQEKQRSDNEGLLFIYTRKGAADTYRKIEENCARLVEAQQFWDELTLPSLPAHGQGFWYRIIVTGYDKATGLWDGRIEKITLKNQTSNDYANSGDYNQIVYENTSVNSQATPTAWAANGVIVEVTNDPNEACQFATRVMVRTAVDRTGHTLGNTATEDVATLLHTQNSLDATNSPVAGDGQAVEDSSVPTEFPGRWRRAYTVRTAKDVLGGQEIESGGEVLSRTTHEASSNSSVDAIEGVGFINSVETAPTQYVNRWRRVETSRKAKNQYAPANTITGAWTENTATQTHVTSLQTPALVNGEIQTTEAIPTEYGDWRQDVRVRKAINQPGAGSTLDASAVANTTIETQADNAVVDQTFVKGHIRDARAEPTDFPGRWRKVVQDTLVLNQNATSNTVTGLYSALEYMNTSAASEATPAGLTGDGKIVISDNKPTREGNYATTVQVREAINRPGLTVSVRADGSETRETNTSSPFVGATPVSTTRYANTIIQTPTEYPGRWEVTNVTAKRELQDTGWFDYSSALTGPSRVRRIKGATREYIDQAIDNMSVVNAISVSPPEVDGFNTYSTVLSETLPLDGGGNPGPFYATYYDEQAFNIREVDKLYDKKYYRVLNCLHRCAGDTNVANVVDYILPASINGAEYITLEKSVTHTDAGIYHQGESVLVANSEYASSPWFPETGWPI